MTTPNTQLNQGNQPAPLTHVRPVHVDYACGHKSAFIETLPLFHPAARVSVALDGVIRINDGQTKCIVCQFNDRVVQELQAKATQQQATEVTPQAAPSK
jgi:hypothetical protein